MKERYNVEVADIPFAIISDDGEEFVRQISETVDSRIRELTANTKYLSTVEAAILLALDYCGEKSKADRKIKSLETQVEILEANLRRLREESAPPREKDATPSSAPVEHVDNTPAAVSVPSEETGAEQVKDDPVSRGRKLRAIEALLGSQLRMDTDDND